MDWERAAPVIIDAVAALGCHVDKLGRHVAFIRTAEQYRVYSVTLCKNRYFNKRYFKKVIDTVELDYPGHIHFSKTI